MTYQLLKVTLSIKPFFHDFLVCPIIVRYIFELYSYKTGTLPSKLKFPTDKIMNYEKSTSDLRKRKYSIFILTFPIYFPHAIHKIYAFMMHWYPIAQYLYIKWTSWSDDLLSEVYLIT